MHLFKLVYPDELLQDGREFKLVPPDHVVEMVRDECVCATTYTIRTQFDPKTLPRVFPSLEIRPLTEMEELELLTGFQGRRASRQRWAEIADTEAMQGIHRENDWDAKRMLDLYGIEVSWLLWEGKDRKPAAQKKRPSLPRAKKGKG